MRGPIDRCEFGAGTEPLAASETEDDADDIGRRNELSADTIDGRRSSSIAEKCRGEGCRGSGSTGGEDDIARRITGDTVARLVVPTGRGLCYT